MFVKEDVRILGPIAIGSEADEELCLAFLASAFLASALLGGAVLGGERQHGKEQRDGEKARTGPRLASAASLQTTEVVCKLAYRRKRGIAKDMRFTAGELAKFGVRAGGLFRG